MKKFIKKIIYKYFYNKDSLKRFKEIHKDEECYIFGGGVSIKWFDLNCFNNKKSIVVNYLPFHNEFKNLNAKYCILSEPFWFFPFEKVVKTLSIKKGFPWYIINYIPNPTQKYYREKILKYNDKHFFINFSNALVLRQNNVTFLFDKISDSKFFDICISKGINAYHGSFRTSISLAIHMGFSKVYLVGFDYTHKPSRVSHWFEKGEGWNYEVENYNENFFLIAREFIEIITVTIDGKSNILPSITYHELTGKHPFYRENNDLVNTKTLKVLSTFPGYKIY
jgi:hypothetical protein